MRAFLAAAVVCLAPIVVALADDRAWAATPDHVVPVTVDTLYDAPGGMVTLITGDPAPLTAPKSGPGAGAPQVLTFSDNNGVVVRVYADHPVPLRVAQTLLAKSRVARERAAEVRRRLAADPRHLSETDYETGTP